MKSTNSQLTLGNLNFQGTDLRIGSEIQNTKLPTNLKHQKNFIPTTCTTVPNARHTQSPKLEELHKLAQEKHSHLMLLFYVEGKKVTDFDLYKEYRLSYHIGHRITTGVHHSLCTFNLYKL